MVEHRQTRYKVSLEDYEARYAGRRYEYIDGYAVPMGPEIEFNGEIIVSPTKSDHGELVSFVDRLFGNFLWERKLGKVYGAETGFVMDQESGQIRAADLAFISKDRIDKVQPGEWLPFPPDLAIEIISEYERAKDIRNKALLYMKNGTALLLLFYPSDKVIDVYRPDQPIITLRPGDTLDCGDVLPGFSVPVSEIFAVLDDLENE